MFSPRNLIIAGLVLVAIALGPSGHGLWWLVGFLWFLPRMAGHGHCSRRTGRRLDGELGDHTAPASVPDPTRDRHEAFPSSR